MFRSLITWVIHTLWHNSWLGRIQNEAVVQEYKIVGYWQPSTHPNQHLEHFEAIIRHFSEGIEENGECSHIIYTNRAKIWNLYLLNTKQGWYPFDRHIRPTYPTSRYVLRFLICNSALMQYLTVMNISSRLEPTNSACMLTKTGSINWLCAFCLHCFYTLCVIRAQKYSKFTLINLIMPHRDVDLWHTSLYNAHKYRCACEEHEASLAEAWGGGLCDYSSNYSSRHHY